MKKRGLLLVLALLVSAVLCAQAQELGSDLMDTLRVVSTKHVQKRYNIYFESGSSRIDRSFHGNGRVLDVIKSDIRTTLKAERIIPDSLMILSMSSPDGNPQFNRRLAKERAHNTKKLLLQMFPEFKTSTILEEYTESGWDGLRQILKTHEEFPQRDRMLSVLDSGMTEEETEEALKACKEGWQYFTDHHIYALRNSSVTLCVILDGVVDEFVRMAPMPDVQQMAYVPTFHAPVQTSLTVPGYDDEVRVKRMIFAPRMNLLVPGFNIGLEIPIRNNWSVGFDYYFPWLLSKKNKWCVEFLGAFVDAKYWFPGDKYKWTPTERLQGHAVGVYAGAGLYDMQHDRKGAQGEYVDFGVDYTFALPLAHNKLRMEFNIGVGLLRTWYRPYYTSSDYSDLIKESGILYNSTNFVGPTRASVSLVVPIMAKTRVPKAYRKGGEK